MCGLTNDDALCQSFIQASLEANNWPNCTAFCSFEIYAGAYQGQDVIVLIDGCENTNSFDQRWEIYNCTGTLLEQCNSSSGGSTCTVGGGILNNVTYVENLYFCGQTLPPCSPGGGNCQILECADQEVVVAFDIFGGIHVDDIVVESSGDCNLSFSSQVDIDFIDLSCANVGVFTTTIYSFDDPSVSCTAQVTVIDNGCFGFCEEFECLDFSAVVSAGVGVTVSVDDLVVGADPSCNFSFDAEFDVDEFDFDCSNVGVFQVTVYNLDDPSLNCTSTITLEDGGCSGSDCEIFECADVEVFPAFDIIATVEVTEVALEFEGECNLSFDPEIDVDVLSYSCGQLGTYTVTVYNLDDPTISCTATVTVSDGGCTLPSDCEIFECADIEVFPAFDVIATVEVTQVALEFEGECNLSFSATEDVDVLFFDCSQLGANEVTVYNLGNSDISCTATITVSDGGCTVPGDCEHPDYAALIALYNSTGGPNWDNNTGWAAGAAGDDCEPCSWYGITCENDRVVCVDLDGDPDDCEPSGAGGNNLVGVIPSLLAQLDMLTALSIDDNGIEMEFPEFITSMTSLEVIGLDGAITGSIPASIGNLTNLREIDMAARLSGPIPSELGTLSTLEQISFLFTNNLSGSLPISLGNLSNLRRLRLDGNELTGPIPASFGNMTEMDNLNLRNNKLSGMLPASLGQLSNLSRFDISGNDLEGCIPLEWQTLCTQATISLGNNPALTTQSWDNYCDSMEGACESVNTEDEVGSGVVIYPNPASDVLYVNSEQPSNLTIKDMQGRRILSQSASKEIELGQLPSGLYFLEVYSVSGEMLDIRKVVKQ